MTCHRYIYIEEIAAYDYDPTNPLHVKHPDDPYRFAIIRNVETVYRDAAGIASPTSLDGFVSCQIEPDWEMFSESAFFEDLEKFAKLSEAIHAFGSGMDVGAFGTQD